MSTQEREEEPLWNTAVRVVANVRADGPFSAVRRLTDALEKAGFEVVDDNSAVNTQGTDVTVGAFEAEDGTEESDLPEGKAQGTRLKRTLR